MARKKTLTDPQQKALNEAEAALARAYEEASAKLKAAGLTIEREPSDGGFQCLRCDCEGYLRGPGLKCKRPGCGHLFTSHDVR